MASVTFHPKNNLDLVFHFKTDSERWEHYDDRLQRWTHGSTTSPDIAVGSRKDVYFRSVGVKDGIKMPQAGHKRDFDSVLESSGTGSTPEASPKKGQSLLSLTYEDIGNDQ